MHKAQSIETIATKHSPIDNAFASQTTIYWAIAAGSLTVILFALSPALTRLAVVEISGLDIGIFRTVGGGLLALPIILILRLQGPKTMADWGLLALSALGSFIGFPILFSLGIETTSASHAALIMATMPLITGAIAMLIERHLPPLSWFFGSAVALLGEILLAQWGKRPAGDSSVIGDALVLLSCISFASGVVAGARLTTRMNPWSATFWGITLASIYLIPTALTRGIAIPWTSMSATTWAALFHIAVGATILAYVAWFWALSRGGIVRLAPLQFAQPVLALLFASVIAREHLPAQSIVAATLIVPGVAIACRAKKVPSKTSGRQNDAAAASAPKRRNSIGLAIRHWQQTRKARLDFATMNYQDRKDLGFPEVFHGRIIAPGRRPDV